MAEGLGRPVTLVIGDLALLHDLNSLALLRQDGPPVILVVINNDGGGIFSFLPVAEHRAVFEPYFGTPHGLSFKAAAALFGLVYHHPVTVAAFKEAYTSACRKGVSTLIEVTTDRAANRALHQDVMGRRRRAAGVNLPTAREPDMLAHTLLGAEKAACRGVSLHGFYGFRATTGGRWRKG